MSYVCRVFWKSLSLTLGGSPKREKMKPTLRCSCVFGCPMYPMVASNCWRVWTSWLPRWICGALSDFSCFAQSCVTSSRAVFRRDVIAFRLIGGLPVVGAALSVGVTGVGLLVSLSDSARSSANWEWINRDTRRGCVLMRCILVGLLWVLIKEMFRVGTSLAGFVFLMCQRKMTGDIKLFILKGPIFIFWG